MEFALVLSGIYCGLQLAMSGNDSRRKAIEAIDRDFLDRARSALASAGCGALEFLAANPGVDQVELARRLAIRSKQRVSGIGLLMAIYDEAVKSGAVRSTAKDLLIRQIRHRFPDGWSTEGAIGPVTKLGKWLVVGKYGGDSRIPEFARMIVRGLAFESQPPLGWKPQAANDPVIDSLFDRFWPIDPVPK